METITQAALFVEDQVATLPRPARHHNLNQALHQLVESVKGYVNEREPFREAKQGFLTNTGRFVGREEAARIAHTAGQTSSLKKMLFSEDLW